ncbi:hypothetical protein ES703_95298 [subsurface metagenome]
MIGLLTFFSDDEASNLYLIRFKVLLIYAIVADKGVGGNDNLPGIGGVGQHLLIPCHAGIKYHFTIGISLSTKGIAFINRAIFQD